MQRPIAFKMLFTGNTAVHRVRLEPLDVSTLKGDEYAPAIVVARKSTMLSDLETGIVDATDIVAVRDGDWANAILILAGEEDIQINNSREKSVQQSAQPPGNAGDDCFFESVKKTTPGLLSLSRKVIDLIRSAGVQGELVEKSKGRWVNTPTNSFTLKVQPRKKNLQFTLYGNPSSYNHDGFLLQDQNSYSRGWVNTEDDAKKLAAFVVLSNDRRTR